MGFGETYKKLGFPRLSPQTVIVYMIPDASKYSMQDHPNAMRQEGIYQSRK